MPVSRTIDSTATHDAIQRMADAIVEAHGNTPKLGLLGIADGGIVLCSRLEQAVAERIGREISSGIIDISFHRDDISTNPIPKASNPTSIPFDIHKATVILVDDVLSTGRSLRAALNEIFDQGRPDRVQVAALFDRGGRLLPFHADFTGFTEHVPEHLKVEVDLSEKDPVQDEIRIIADPSAKTQ